MHLRITSSMAEETGANSLARGGGACRCITVIARRLGSLKGYLPVSKRNANTPSE